jgi:hypothetical protein
METSMLRKALTGGLTAAAIACSSLVSMPAPASAASVQFFFGPTTSQSMWHNGRRAIYVCRTKYKWVWRHHHRERVRVGKDCHWTYPAWYQRPLFEHRWPDRPPMKHKNY